MKKIFAANWKLHKTPVEAQSFCRQLREQWKSIADRELVIFPPSLIAETVSAELAGSSISWGIQNSYWEPQGAFTGENSARVAKEMGARYVLIGHSERRKLFLESDQMIQKKALFVQKEGLIPMICLGETLEERQQGKTQAVLEVQLRAAVEGLDVRAPVVMAYEPVWAIGTGQIATSQQVSDAHEFLHRLLTQIGFSETPILYGGSVKPENSLELLSIPYVRGFLIGGSSLEVSSFLAIASR